MSHPQQQPRVVPWRTAAELVLLRNDFYPNLESGVVPDRRAAALAKVEAWQVRSVRMPHAIEATAQLTAAVLLDTGGTPPTDPTTHSSRASTLAQRLAYSTAICRFVNGLLDPAQQAVFALPMQMLARQFKLPASFVELRHTATHEALPSLAVLRVVAIRALDWLWRDYWAAIGVVPPRDAGDGDGVEDKDVLVSRARATTRAWRTLRRENPRRSVRAGGAKVAAIVKECVRICGCVSGGGSAGLPVQQEGVQALIAALLEEKALIPAGRRRLGKVKGDGGTSKGMGTAAMKGARLLWVPLLEAVEAAVPGFVASLVDSMLGVLRAGGDELSDVLLEPAEGGEDGDGDGDGDGDSDGDGDGDGDDDDGDGGGDGHDRAAVAGGCDAGFLAAVVAWLEFLTAEKQTRSGGVGAGIDVKELARKALVHPNQWNIQLLLHVLSEHPALQSKYQPLVELASSHVRAPSGCVGGGGQQQQPQEGKKRPLQEIEAEVDAFEERFEKMHAQWQQEQERNRAMAASAAMDTAGTKEEGGWETRPQAAGNLKWRRWDGNWTPKPLGVV